MLSYRVMKSSQFTFLSLENQNGEKASEKGNTLEKTFSRVHLKGNNTEENEHRRSFNFSSSRLWNHEGSKFCQNRSARSKEATGLSSTVRQRKVN